MASASPRYRSRIRACATALAVCLVLAACSAAGSEPQAETDDPKPRLARKDASDAGEYAPLTGLPAGDLDVDRAALAVKIDNHPEAHPQAGLNDADFVIEEVVESGLTRFMAVFHTRGADHIGPVRSGRPVDVELLHGLGDPRLVMSGAADPVLAMFRDARIAYVNADDGDSGFRRDSGAGHRQPHDLFTSTGAIRASLDGPRGAPLPPALFSTKPPPSATPAPGVTVAFSDKSLTRWVYDGGRGVYVRHLNGAPQLLADGSDVVADNLVFQIVEEVPTGLTDSVGEPVPDWKVTGSGDVMVARGGEIARGTWSRATPPDETVLQTENGETITLAPGRTWWSLVPTSGAVNAS